MLASVTEQADLSLTFFEPPKTGSLATRPISVVNARKRVNRFSHSTVLLCNYIIVSRGSWKSVIIGCWHV